MMKHMKQLFLFAALSTVTFFFSGALSDVDSNFTLSCMKPFGMNERPVVQVESYNFSGNLHFRVYKVEDPVAFFEKQRDVHSPDITSLRETNVYKIFGAAFDKLTRDAREAARKVMPDHARNVMIGVADIRRSSDDKTKSRDSIASKIPGELEGYPIVKEWNQFLEREKNEWMYKSIEVDVHSPGVYLVEAKSLGKVAYTVVIVSKYGMITKRSDTKLAAFVVDRESGKRIDAYPVNVYFEKKKIASGKTDNGLFSTLLPQEKKSGAHDEMMEWDNNSGILIMGYQDNQFIISDPYYYPYGNSSARFVLLTYPERPIYRPGQEVYFKSIIREWVEEKGLLNYAGKPMSVTITDSRGSTVHRDSMTTNEFGTINGHFTLADEPPLGFYSIRVRVEDNEYYADFQVEEYKKPEYKVEVTTEKQNFARGDVIKATVKADYFFGSPVTGAEVEYFVFRSRYWRPWWRGTDYEWYYEEDGGESHSYRQEMIESNTAKLDEKGELSISVYTDAIAKQDFIYRIQANVVDQSRRSISAAKSVEVTRGLFGVTLRNAKWVYKPKDKIDLTVTTRDFKNNPVAAPFIVKVTRVWWDRIEYQQNNVTQYKYNKHEAVTAQFAGKTGADGAGVVYFNADQSGYYSAEVTATDSRGNKIAESASVYVADESYTAYWGNESDASITIIPDKASYKPGETMHALVTMPLSNSDALVSIECGDMYETIPMHFDGSSKMIDVEIREEFVPNIYLSVSTMLNGEFVHQSTRILTLPQEKFLNVELLNDKRIYLPGESGTLHVQVTDGEGSPVRNAEVSISVVDEAVYAIAPENTRDMKKTFYAVRYNEVETQASVYFNFYGYSRSLRKDEMALDAANAKAGHAMAMSVEEAKKIAYGDVKGELFQEAVVRKDFRDMILWSPTVVTDGNGSARVVVKYPDNLTTWRATARVINKETQVGSSVSRVIARKDLIVRMETPRYFMEGDECSIATIVHNYLNTEKRTKVILSGTNVSIEEKERTITVPHNGQMRIDWTVKTQKPGPTTLVVKALTNEESDAMELSVPTLARGIQVAEARMMDTEKKNDSKTEFITLPEGTNLETAELYLNASPSLASAVLSAMDELIGYPYGCVEQTMSKFLPTVIISNALEKLGAPMASEKKKEIPKMVASGLKRLYNMQHSDGGWGWWTNDETNPFMTAYVAYGMVLAKEAGHDVLTDVVARGIRKLNSLSETKDLDPTTKAYLLYVLALSNNSFAVLDKNILSSTIRNFHPNDPNNYALALLALAHHSSGNRNEAFAYVSQLERTKKFQDKLVYWEGKSWHYDWQNDNVETTALALKAILNIRGDGSDVKGGIRWLLSQRKGFSWESTRQTAMTIFTLVDYMKTSQEMNPDYTLWVFVNDHQVWQKRMTRSEMFNPNQRIRVDTKYFRAGQNNLRIEKRGDGTLYFTARMMYHTPERPIAAHASGFAVKREYYRLIKQRYGNEIFYVKQPFAGTAQPGDEIFVRVSVNASDRSEYFMLEDPLPAGCEVIKQTDGYRMKSEPGYDQKYYYGWRWWWADRDVRDEKVAFFARYVDAGKYEFTYIMRAQIPGRYSIMPSIAQLMYYPEVRGNSSEQDFEIRE